MNNFSPNMLKTFKSCPIKYYFKYIKKISVPQKSSLFEKGKKIHALANYYLRGDNISKLETALNETEKKVWQSLKNNEYFQKNYVNSEYNLSCRIGNYWIGGRLDALMKDENNYYILDYKTGSIPQNPEYDYQTMVYLLCTAQMYGKNLKFVYIDLHNNKNYVIDYTDEAEYKKYITEICDNIVNAQFSEGIEHSNKCNLCEYKKICI